MLPPIESTGRRVVIKNCVIVGLCAMMLLPAIASPSDWIANHEMPFRAKQASGVAAEPLEWKPIVVDRDPFVATFQPQNSASASAAIAVRDIVGMRVIQGHPLSSLGVPTAIIRAIAIGRTARALVEINGITRVVGPGDKVGSFTIKSILANRVQLSDGSVLTLDRKYP